MSEQKPLWGNQLVAAHNTLRGIVAKARAESSPGVAARIGRQGSGDGGETGALEPGRGVEVHTWDGTRSSTSHR